MATPKSTSVWTKEQALAHIAARTKIDHETGCHEWQGSRTKDGYGQSSSRPLERSFPGHKLIHRLVVHLVTGFVFTSRNQQVMHSCHNRKCCNPNHLSVGTAKENQAASIAIGTAFLGMLRGEDHPKAIYTEEMVREARRMMLYGWKNNLISQRLGMNPSSVASIRAGKCWRHVTISPTVC